MRHLTNVLLLGALVLLCLPGRAANPLQLQLARAYQPGIDVSAYWISEKLDGVRARWDGHRLLSRQGNPFAVPAWFTAGFPAQPLDGELWIARGTFEQVSGIVRRQQPDDADWRPVRFMLFDLPDPELSFSQRLLRLRQLVTAAGVLQLGLIEQFRVSDSKALLQRMQQVVAAGGEGLMLHHQDARYRSGRVDHLLKLKPFEDAEARVIGHLPGQGRLQGMLGALLVETPQGVRFRLGSGFSDAQRRAPPPPGSIVTYRYSGLTGNGIPRFASFLRVRDDEPSP